MQEIYPFFFIFLYTQFDFMQPLCCLFLVQSSSVTTGYNSICNTHTVNIYDCLFKSINKYCVFCLCCVCLQLLWLHIIIASFLWSVWNRFPHEWNYRKSQPVKTVLPLILPQLYCFNDEIDFSFHKILSMAFS